MSAAFKAKQRPETLLAIPSISPTMYMRLLAKTGSRFFLAS